MIDIHTHIIPDLDDGPPDMETSVGIGKLAEEDGITAIISTSHSEECAAVGFTGMHLRLDAVRKAWAAEGLSIRLAMGVEIFLRPDTASDLKSGRLWSLAGSSYVLVELPNQPWPAYTESALFDLQLAGYVPILAHPERYTAIQSDPNVMYGLAERGVLGQITASALLGLHGAQIQQTAEILLRHGLAQFLSTDTHGLTDRKRKPQLAGALAQAVALVGQDTASALVADNPACIFTGKHVVAEPQPVTLRKWSIGRLFGRE